MRRFSLVAAATSVVDQIRPRTAASTTLDDAVDDAIREAVLDWQDGFLDAICAALGVSASTVDHDAAPLAVLKVGDATISVQALYVKHKADYGVYVVVKRGDEVAGAWTVHGHEQPGPAVNRIVQLVRP